MTTGSPLLHMKLQEEGVIQLLEKQKPSSVMMPFFLFETSLMFQMNSLDVGVHEVPLKTLQQEIHHKGGGDYNF